MLDSPIATCGKRITKYTPLLGIAGWSRRFSSPRSDVGQKPTVSEPDPLIEVRYCDESASSAVAAWMTAACAFCGCLAAGFFEPIGEHGFGVIGGPLVGQHLVETRIVVVQAEQQLTQIGPGLDPMSLGTGENVNKTAARSPACALPRNNQFFLPIAWWRSVRSLMLLLIESRPSST
ncbi:MAG TPA: hypothetical protein VGN12_19015 [Pirellulales bacterium]|jgi:hypothetical protein